MNFEQIILSLQSDLISEKGFLLPWNWICEFFLELMYQYPDGLTKTLVLNELQLAVL